MTSNHGYKASAWAGIAILPTAVIPLALTGEFPMLFPRWSIPPAQLATWFAVHESAIDIQIVTGNVALLLMVWFAAGLTQTLRVPSRPTLYTRLITPTAVAVAATYTAANGLWLLAAIGVRTVPMSADLIAYAIRVGIVVWLGSQPIAAFMLFAAAVAILHTHVLPRWLAWSAITIAVPNFLVTFAALLKDGWLAPVQLATVVPYALFMLWQVTAAMSMLRPTALFPRASLNPQGSDWRASAGGTPLRPSKDPAGS
ncbi:hypothetical protein ACIBAG_31955 [Streptomyces sp. NPDC051243]|uniref:hypothetical protein n=1 Tax=Streptomyces sp. NPDC051243 TaxID=3365646 RepID=UPI0037945A6E